MTETPSLIAPFGDIVKREAEFSAAAALPDCEVELLGALISRYLHDELFTRPLYGPELPGVAFISAAAASMAKHTEPRKGRRAYPGKSRPRTARYLGRGAVGLRIS